MKEIPGENQICLWKHEQFSEFVVSHGIWQGEGDERGVYVTKNTGGMDNAPIGELRKINTKTFLTFLNSNSGFLDLSKLIEEDEPEEK